jgi:hypothetical protein
MRKFLKKTVFLFVPITIILFSGLGLPPTPRASKSHLFASRQKDSLLLITNEPRIIFVGGSNLSFGLNSYRVEDSLHLNPINTAVHASLGIKYMLQNTIQYVKKGDIIILAFEYQHFYRPYDFVSDELLRTIFDVSPDKASLLSLKQVINLLQYVPKFSITKFKPTEYVGFKESDIYSVNSFNKFGDIDAHWNMKRRDYQPCNIKGKFNTDVLKKIKEFETAAKHKGAMVYLTYPSLDELSFENSREPVLDVEKFLKESNFKILGNARRYIFPKKMMFNTFYHLNREGLEYRTDLFIEDYKRARTKSALQNNASF